MYTPCTATFLIMFMPFMKIAPDAEDTLYTPISCGAVPNIKGGYLYFE